MKYAIIAYGISLMIKRLEAEKRQVPDSLRLLLYELCCDEPNLALIESGFREALEVYHEDVEMALLLDSIKL